MGLFKNINDYVHPNVFAIALVSFFMQFGATMVHGVGNTLIAGSLMSIQTLILVRSISEALPGIIKIVTGYLSDKFENRTVFLFIGYGSMIILKFMFFISVKFSIPTVYIVAQILDRVMNSIRDAPKDALIVDSSKEKNMLLSFSIRKGIGSLGTILGALMIYYVVSKKILNVQQIFFFSIFPVIFANLILYKLIKNIKFKTIQSIEYNDLQDKNTMKNYSLIAIIPTIIFSSISLLILKEQKLLLILFFILSYLFFMFFLKKYSLSQMKIYYKQSKNFFYILFITALLFFCRMNDIIFLTKAQQIGIKSEYTILLFAYLYLCISVFSLISPFLKNHCTNLTFCYNKYFQGFFAIIFSIIFFITYRLKNSPIIFGITSISIIFILLFSLKFMLQKYPVQSDQLYHLFELCVYFGLLILANGFLSASKGIFGIIISLTFLGIFISSTEVFLVNKISQLIPSQNLRGTFLGIFYATIGIFCVISVFVTNLLIQVKGINFSIITFTLVPLLILFLIAQYIIRSIK